MDVDELPSFRSAKLQIWALGMICTWRGHPNRRRVLFRGHLTSQASLLAVRPSFCSTRFVQFARRCSSGTSQVTWSTDGVRYIIFSAACILQCRTLCSAIYVAPRAKEKISIRIHCTSVPFSLPTEINVLTLVHAVFLSYDTVNGSGLQYTIILKNMITDNL